MAVRDYLVTNGPTIKTHVRAESFVVLPQKEWLQFYVRKRCVAIFRYAHWDTVYEVTADALNPKVVYRREASA